MKDSIVLTAVLNPHFFNYGTSILSIKLSTLPESIILPTSICKWHFTWRGHCTTYLPGTDLIVYYFLGDMSPALNFAVLMILQVG